jgi:hypothetical protein
MGWLDFKKKLTCGYPHYTLHTHTGTASCQAHTHKEEHTHPTTTSHQFRPINESRSSPATFRADAELLCSDRYLLIHRCRRHDRRAFLELISSSFRCLSYFSSYSETRALCCRRRRPARPARLGRNLRPPAAPSPAPLRAVWSPPLPPATPRR